MNVSDHEQFEITGVTVWVDDDLGICGCDETLKGTCSSSSTVQINKDVEHDVEIIQTNQPVNLKFVPLVYDHKIVLCEKFGITKLCLDRHEISKICEKLSKPDSVKTIQGDGNCFYRAISYAISGTEDNHMQLRLAIVHHLLENAAQFRCCLREGYRTVQEYVTNARLCNNGTWATEVEIIVTAHMLDVGIYTYDDANRCKWYLFSSSYACPGRASDSSVKSGIYLHHKNQIHYDLVTSVCELRRELPIDSTQKHDENTSKTRVLKRSKRRKRVNVKKRQKTNREKQRERYQRKKDKENKNDGVNVREKKKRAKKEKYHSCVQYRQGAIEYGKKRYKENVKSITGVVRKRYHENADYRNNKIGNAKMKYDRDEEHRQRKKQCTMTNYHKNIEYRQQKINNAKTRYEDAVHRQEKINFAKAKYHENEEHRQRKVKSAKTKYHENEGHRQRKVKSAKTKYHENEEHRQRKMTSAKKYTKKKYHSDLSYRNALVKSIKKKYSLNKFYRMKLINFQKAKYHTDRCYRQNMKQRNDEREKRKRASQCIMNNVMRNWRQDVSSGPEYICAVCHKLLFRKQVVKCYQKKYKCVYCICGKFVHTCRDNGNCGDKCKVSESSRSCLWICYTCHRKLLQNRIPAEACANNLALEDIPEELSCLNILEEHLIAINVAFMKMMALPRGGQNAVHGPVVCVPSNISETVTSLPRCGNNNQLIKVKLKRKLSFKGYYQYQYVSREHVERALYYLKEHNVWYNEIEINCEWDNPLEDESEKQEEHESDNSSENDEDTDVDTDVDTDEERLTGITYDTCLQPVNIAQDALDQDFDGVMCVAPCERNSPVRLFMEEANEAKCFPALFPSGTSIFRDDRDVKLSLTRYFHNRLMNADNR
ncbi:uncharacterized protein LOC119732934, partial [Patiria miniata]|uniref:OTU domain-containing protein n=1 Tax=Patiria miniata TaxID=46514 RepID=A0A914AFC3_PATMI